MNKLFFALILFLMFSCEVQKLPADQLSNLKPVKLYDTTEDYLNRKAREVDAGVLIKNQSNQHITIKGFFDLKTGLAIKRGISAWAIEYDSSRYFNLGYTSVLNYWKSYAKFDIEGKYCAIIIDANSPNVLGVSSSNNNGGMLGLGSALAAESVKWNKNWRDKDGIKKRVLFINTNNIAPQIFSRNAGSPGEYLTRQDVRDLISILGLTLGDAKVNELPLEEVIFLIKKANKK
ncbi:MAG: hypothetical protein QE277_09315 [Flectobacillus sp.]|nr:hypothetical protein [Flectobacillus sp.]